MFQGLSALFFIGCCILFLGALANSGGMIIIGFLALAASAGTSILLGTGGKGGRRR